MGYACPVCGSPQADRRHLANHLAFTAMIHGEAHERWLDEHAPEWETAGEEDLAARIDGDVREAPFPPENADEGHGHEGHEHTNTGEAIDRPATDGEAAAGRITRTDTDPSDRAQKEGERSVEAVLADARRMTERMMGTESAENGAEADAERADGEDGE